MDWQASFPHPIDLDPGARPLSASASLAPQGRLFRPRVREVAFTADGALVTMSADRLDVYDPETGALSTSVPVPSCHAPSFDPEGGWMYAVEAHPEWAAGGVTRLTGTAFRAHVDGRVERIPWEGAVNTAAGWGPMMALATRALKYPVYLKRDGEWTLVGEGDHTVKPRFSRDGQWLWIGRTAVPTAGGAPRQVGSGSLDRAGREYNERRVKEIDGGERVAQAPEQGRFDIAGGQRYSSMGDVELSPDERHHVEGGHYGNFIVRSYPALELIGGRTGQEHLSGSGHYGRGIAVSNTHVAVLSIHEGVVRVYRLADLPVRGPAQPVLELAHNEPLASLSVSADGATVVCTGTDGHQLRRTETASGASWRGPRHERRESNQETFAAISPDGVWLAFAADARSTGKQTRLERVDGSAPGRAAKALYWPGPHEFGPDGDSYVTASAKRGERPAPDMTDWVLRKVSSTRAVRTVRIDGLAILPAFSADGGSIVVATRRGLALVQGGKEVDRVDLPAGGARGDLLCVAVRSDGRVVAVQEGVGGFIREKGATRPFVLPARAMALRFRPDGAVLYVGTSTGEIHSVDAESGAVLATAAAGGAVAHLRIVGEQLWCGGVEGEVRVFGAG